MFQNGLLLLAILPGGYVCAKVRLRIQFKSRFRNVCRQAKAQLKKRMLSQFPLSHPYIIRLRNIARRIGLTKLLSFAYHGRGYEPGVETALADVMKTGDVVWDVGANFGHYTVTIADKIRPSGKVYAFEPSPPNLIMLNKRCKDLNNVYVFPIGLSSSQGWVNLIQGADEVGATSRIAPSPDADTSGRYYVELRSGDVWLNPER
jgi:FkbM family methyltransferase